MDDPEITALIPAVEQQLTSPETPFVATAYAHLLELDDVDEDEAKYMIAFCLADEIEKVNREERAFDLERYRTLIALLPNLPE